MQKVLSLGGGGAIKLLINGVYEYGSLYHFSVLIHVSKTTR